MAEKEKAKERTRAQNDLSLPSYLRGYIAQINDNVSWSSSSDSSSSASESSSSTSV